jgi:hypothetical protein
LKKSSTNYPKEQWCIFPESTIFQQYFAPKLQLQPFLDSILDVLVILNIFQLLHDNFSCLVNRTGTK